MDYFQTLGDLKDTRVLLTFVNSLYEDVFTPDIMLNDKWSVNLALEAISNILRIKSDFDSEVSKGFSNILRINSNLDSEVSKAISNVHT